eukprot:gene9379-10359_t
MRTECFIPSILPSYLEEVREKNKEIQVVEESCLVLSKGWCRTEGVLGSAFGEMNGSKVACYVFTPRPSNKLVTGFESGSVECDVTLAPHLPQENSDAAVALQKRLAQKIVDAVSPVILLEHYPKNVIYISAVIFESSSFDLVNLLNCASLALCDAEVEMKDVLSACSLSLPQKESTNNSQSSEGYSSSGRRSGRTEVSMAYLAKAGEVVALDCSGKLSTKELNALLDQCKEQCSRIRELIISRL